LKKFFGLFLFLYLIWLLLSGHYSLLFMALGFISCLGGVFLAHKMGLVDEEGIPAQLVPAIFRYIPWLSGTIIRSNIDVAMRILNPRLPISPEVIRVPATQRTSPGRVLYANSITLTPGTLSLELTNSDIEVHALSLQATKELQSGDMGKRVASLET